jgi:hypothetical protein
MEVEMARLAEGSFSDVFAACRGIAGTGAAVTMRLVALAALLIALATPAFAEEPVTCRDAVAESNWQAAYQECLWAANNGEVYSQITLAYMYYQGQGVPQNFAQAAKLFRQAAETGNALAQNNLGFMYSNGQGMLQNYVLAHMWYNLAASQGEQTALRNRTHLERLMPPAQIAEAQTLAKDASARSSGALASAMPVFDSPVAVGSR